MTALLFKNTTGLTLEGGPLTVLEEESYVGESMLETMKPEEERLVPHSVELSCLITVDHRSRKESVRAARIRITDWMSTTERCSFWLLKFSKASKARSRRKTLDFPICIPNTRLLFRDFLVGDFASELS